MTVTPVIGGKI